MNRGTVIGAVLLISLACAVPREGLAHVASYVDKGAIAVGAIKTGTLTNTLVFEYAHHYRFTAAAGQKVTFVLEIPASRNGAWLGLTAGTGFPPSSYLKQARSTTAGSVHFEHTFAAAGTYHLWIRQGNAVPGSFAYRLGADAALCSMLEGDYAGYESAVTYVVKEFPVGAPFEAWTWTMDDPQFSEQSREVALGRCRDVPASGCDDQTEVCGATFLGQWLFASECAVIDYIHELGSAQVDENGGQPVDGYAAGLWDDAAVCQQE